MIQSIECQSKRKHPQLIQLITGAWLSLELAIRNWLINWISWYQQNLSPSKGYSCAYRVLHNGESCSCYVKNILSEQNILTAITLSSKRFDACGKAAQILRIESTGKEGMLDSDSGSNIRKNTKHYGRRKFIYHGMLGFAMPMILNGRGTGECCESCLIPLGKILCRDAMRGDEQDDRDRRRYDY